MAGVEVQIGANTEELDAAIKRSKSQLRQLSDEMRSGIGTAAKYGAAAVAAGGALATGLTIKGLAAVDAQAKLAKQLGTTSESMAVMARAGELSGISVEKINASATRLTRRLSLAEAGAGPAADAIKRLGLSASEVAALPLDERISAVNTAINEMIPAAQQAGVATQLFGEEAGIAMRSLTPEVIAQARKEAELFGTAVSDVDAAQVEAANDAFSTMGLALEGVSKRLAVEVAPILTAVSKQFFAAAEEAGGFGESVSDAFQFVVDSAAFVMDAVEGIRRVFSVVADGIIAGWNKMFQMVAGHIANIIELVQNLPGMGDFMSGPLESIRNFGATAEGVVDQAMNNIHATLMRELPSGQFKRFVDEAREQAEVVAEEGLNMSNMLLGSEDQWEEDTEKALERQNLRNELMLERQKAAEEMMTEIKQKNEEQRQAQAEQQAKLREQVEGDMWNSLTSLMNSGSRKLFEIGKVSAIAESIMSTYKGATKALELGWPLGPIAAAAITTAGFANVARIQSQSFSKGGGGGPAPTAQLNEAAQGTAQGGSAQPSERTIANVSIQGGDVFSRSSVISLAEQMAELSDDGVSFRVTA